MSSANEKQEKGTNMASKQDSQGWPFSDEAAARDAGIIPPDPTADQEPGVDPIATPPEDFVSAITTTVDQDAATQDAADGDATDQDAADSTEIQPSDPATRPDADHPVNSGDYPSQPHTARASDEPDRTGYQNDADPPR